MTRKTQIDWLCRLKSEIKIFMPYQWQKPFEEALDMAIKAPSWIPVSERLPEDSGEYLVSVIDEYNENQCYYKAVEVAWFAHKKDYDIKESEWRELGIDETVIAWMPLPQPYKEVEE